MEKTQSKLDKMLLEHTNLSEEELEEVEEMEMPRLEDLETFEEEPEE